MSTVTDEIIKNLKQRLEPFNKADFNNLLVMKEVQHTISYYLGDCLMRCIIHDYFADVGFKNSSKKMSGYRIKIKTWESIVNASGYTHGYNIIESTIDVPDYSTVIDPIEAYNRAMSIL